VHNPHCTTLTPLHHFEIHYTKDPSACRVAPSATLAPSSGLNLTYPPDPTKKGNKGYKIKHSSSIVFNTNNIAQTTNHECKQAEAKTHLSAATICNNNKIP